MAKAMTDRTALTGVEKAAILLISLGEEKAAGLLRQMPAGDVEKVVAEIGRRGEVGPPLKEQVIREFLGLVDSTEGVAPGGWDYARSALEKALGQARAGQVLGQAGRPRRDGFGVLEQARPDKLVTFLSREHPQTIALLMTQLPAPKSAAVLAGLDDVLRPEVMARIAAMDRVPGEALGDLRRVISEDLGEALAPDEEDAETGGGPEAAAAIVNAMDKEIAGRTLESLAEVDPELVTEIRNKMFVFEDLGLLDDRGVQRFLKEVESKVLSVALKAASPEIKEAIFRNMSKRAAELLKEEMEMMGPVRLSAVDEAKASMVEVIRRLVEDGEVTVAGRGGQEDQLVG